jgi:PTH1 family peptidyl-tRNA hydrolase
MIARIGSPEFVRVRVGIGRPPADWKGDVADYVLSDFDPTERARLGTLVDDAKRAVELVVRDGALAAMGVVNAKAPPRNGPRKA